MAQGDPYARIIKMMQREGAHNNGHDMALAQVLSVEPVSIAVNGQPISAHIYCNVITDSDKDEQLEEILAAEEFISSGLKMFIKELYEGLRVKPGDQVLVQRVGNSFYICGKVVPVG